MNRRLPLELAEQLLRGASHDAGGLGILVSDLICTTTEYTADTTWIKPANFIKTYVEAQAAGGGGGGVDVGVGESAVGGGAGGGAYEAKWLLNREVGKSEAITIGAGGTGGSAASATAATNGGDTSFGSHVVASGGTAGGNTTTDGTGGTNGSGGSASGSQVNRSGQGSVINTPAAGAAFVLSRPGGNSHLGYGGRSRLLGAGTSLAGLPGGDGGGGGGGAACQSGTAADGADGGAGKLILHVWTYAKA